MKASDLLVRCLENEGVRYVFGLPGEETLDVLDSLSRSDDVEFVVCRHEQAAAFMANVYGRLSTYPGVCLATLGPGATNLITGVADAHLDRAPIVAITGQASQDRLFKESHQYLDVLGLFQPVTKWNARVVVPETLPEIVRKAFRLARLEKPGATHIELPEDVAAEEVDALPMPVRRTNYPVARPESVARAAELLQQARKPIILSGNGVIRRQASEALEAFATRLSIPVVTTFMGKGAIDYRSPVALPSMGLRSADAPLGLLGEADLVLAVGYDLVEWSPEVWNPKQDRTILHIDSIAAEVDRAYLPATEVVGEIGESLRSLDAALAGFTPRWGWGSLEAHDYDASLLMDNSYPVRPQRVVHDLRHALADDDILISDVGVHKLWIATRFPASRPNTVVIPNGLASMGIALPGAIAAKLVHPDRKVVAVMGDGGFLMNSQELETAKRMKTAFVAVVLVDDRYGVIELNQKRKFGRGFGVEFQNPDLVMYAKSFGLPAFAVASADQLLPTLRKAMDLDEPCLVAVPVDPSQSPADLT
ncbi:MAG: acetolactate synthase large subunit [Dehalococcoidia bacterium]|nr:acetolactate synthase large subunit [Dehalococcoidia bacterium]